MSKTCGFRYCKGMENCFLAQISPCRHIRQAPPDTLVSDEVRKPRVVSRIGFVDPGIFDDEARA